MKFINSLIDDIYSTVQKKDGWLNNSLASSFGQDIANRVKAQFEARSNKGTLRLSKMGDQCPCALWYSVNHPEMAEQMPPQAEIKFTYGHILEAQVVMLAKAAGHEVVGEQDAVYVDGITGHRDCIIDGCLVDVKSANSRAFLQYKAGVTADIDTFGVLSQLDGYMVGSLDDPLLRVKDRAYILAIDKVLGHLHLHEHKLREDLIRERIYNAKRVVDLGNPPHCTCETTKDGESGNRKLGFKAAYNPYKFCCFPDLRVFIYKGKAPVYLTTVVRKPDVLEVDRHGHPVYMA